MNTLRLSSLPSLVLSVLFLLLIAFAGTGCMYTSYESKSGSKLKRFSLGATQNIGSVSAKTAGGDSFQLDGFSSETAQTAAAITEAAVKAATNR
jgi:hypothetical protein